MEEVRTVTLATKEVRYIRKKGRNWYSVADLSDKLGLSKHSFRSFVGKEFLREDIDEVGRGKAMCFVNTDQIRKVGRLTRSPIRRMYGEYANKLNAINPEGAGGKAATGASKEEEACNVEAAHKVADESVPTIDDLIAILKKKGAKSVRIEF